MTKAELLSRISSRELSEWQAYYIVEPFGEYRADLRNAIVACVIANANRGKNTRAFTVKDFMPNFEPSKPQPLSEMHALLNGMAARFGVTK